MERGFQRTTVVVGACEARYSPAPGARRSALPSHPPLPPWVEAFSGTNFISCSPVQHSGGGRKQREEDGAARPTES